MIDKRVVGQRTLLRLRTAAMAPWDISRAGVAPAAGETSRTGH
ncbi:MAG TPA: hypothetical protein VGD71_11745 [Kribbella sp.]